MRARLVRIPAIRTLRARVRGLRLESVLEVVAALEAAGAPAWVAGGWGVDALVGRQTRAHEDLDLVVTDAEALARVERALGAHGFRLISRDAVPAGLFRRRSLLRDAAGRVVDVHPIAVADAAGDLVTGSIDGHRVPCVSIAIQLAAHDGYPLSWRHRRDMRLLKSLR